MKFKIKNKIAVIFSMTLLLTLILTGSVSAATEHSWYCKRETDHKTSKTPLELSFISNYNAYSYDKDHSSYDSDDKVIYLTFDAGYENGNVKKILNVLKEENVTAAFFILGNLVIRNTDLVKRMASEGHLVCNHTYSHKNMTNVKSEELLAELKKLEDEYEKSTGCKLAKYYRPPEGRFSEDNLKALSDAGYKTIFWSFAYADWNNDSQLDKNSALKKLCDNLHNGEIMLLHPTSSTNAEILSDFIKYAKSEGFRFASLDELK